MSTGKELLLVTRGLERRCKCTHRGQLLPALESLDCDGWLPHGNDQGVIFPVPGPQQRICRGGASPRFNEAVCEPQRIDQAQHFRVFLYFPLHVEHLSAGCL
jgi:hypothetical protein